jgi:CheY-like chemotaxis protein
MTKILVADDEADLEVLIKQKFRRQIREHEYEFIFAINGNDALKKLEENRDRHCAFRHQHAGNGWPYHCSPG